LSIVKGSLNLLIGLLILLSIITFSIVGIITAKHDPLDMVDLENLPPSSQRLLGTDSFGRDLFVEVSFGILNSLRIGVMAGLIATFIGIIIGATAGFKGGIVDEILNLFTNVVLVLPALPLLIVLGSYLRIRNEYFLSLLIGIISWPWTARAIRAQTYSLKTRDFIDVSRISGLSDLELIVLDILPNMLSYIVMAFALQMGGAILSEAGLSMIGLGPTDVVTLGMILRWAYLWEAVRRGVWWWIVPPGLIITLISVSLLLINIGLDEVFNPRLKRG
jgi:peptide/nickel transport system permease protein